MRQLLTDGEKLVFDHLVDGLTNTEIAAKLFISEKTVRFHKTAIFKKTQLKHPEKVIAEFWKMQVGELMLQAEKMRKQIQNLVQIEQLPRTIHDES